MLSADSVSSIRMLALIPDSIKGMAYKKVNEGDVKTIVKVAYSVYKAKSNGSYVVRQDGSDVLNITAYVGFDDGTYATFKGDVALAQLVSETGEFAFESEGVYEFPINNLRVRIISVPQKYGREKKEYKVLAFEPM